MIKLFVFMLIIFRILEENQISLTMNRLHAHIEIQMHMSSIMKKHVQINMNATYVTDGKKMNIILSIIKLNNVLLLKIVQREKIVLITMLISKKGLKFE